MTYNELLELDPFDLLQEKKERLLAEALQELTEHHRERCSSYDRILSSLGFEQRAGASMETIPFLPVRLFKELDLASVSREDVFKVMTSSGTTGQRPSKIFLDRETAANQQKTLARIVTSFTGNARMPMLIIDAPSTVKNRAMFSARGAGILGFSMFGRKTLYALDDNMNLQLDAVQRFIEEHRGKKILLFGFTFMVWKHLYQALHEKGLRLDFGDAILIHGGGWKKMAEQAVTPEAFRQSLGDTCGIPQVCNYYGMVEQTGCIYMECEEGHLHASAYSDVILRRGEDFSVCDVGEKGILQVLSPLPKSYPGHSLLTEDEGVLLGVDDCPCGRKGKYFSVLGRLAQAELRGCSDTYAVGS